MPYKYIEHVSMADVTVEATGKDLTEVFQSAADATIKVMAKPETVEPKITKEISIENKEPAKLLFEFIEELIYIKDADSMVFHSVSVKVEGDKCTATVRGDLAHPEKQELETDIKAITMHYYTLEKKEEGWRAQFVLDV